MLDHSSICKGGAETFQEKQRHFQTELKATNDDNENRPTTVLNVRRYNLLESVSVFININHIMSTNWASILDRPCMQLEDLKLILGSQNFMSISKEKMVSKCMSMLP